MVDKFPDRMLGKFDSLLGKFSQYHGEVLKNRRYFELDFNEEIKPSKFRDDMMIVNPGTARLAIQEAADHILPHPKIKVAARKTDGKETEEQEIAEIKRQFLNAWWYRVGDMFNPIGDGTPILLNEGKLAIRVTLRWDLLPEKPAKGNKNARARYRTAMKRLGKDAFLWDVRVLDNITVYEDPSSHRNPHYLFLRYKVLTEEAKRRWPEAKGKWLKNDDYSEVEYTEYWSLPRDGDKKGSYIQWIDGEMVHNKANPYPYIPVAIEDAGYGRVYDTATIHDKFVGMTQHTRSIFIAEARQMTSMEAVAEITAFPMITARNLDPGKTLNVGPGAINDLEGSDDDPTREQITIEQWPEVPLTVIQLMNKTNALANSILKMTTLGGSPLPGVETATENDALLRNAGAKLSRPLGGLERLVVRISSWVLMDIEQVLEAPVTVRGTARGDAAEIELQPKMIGGNYIVQVELTTRDADAVNQVKARFWAEMTRVVPFLSYMTAMERGDMSDAPQDEMTRRAAEDLFLSPEFASLRLASGARSFGELERMIIELSRDQNTTQAGNAGTGANSAGALVSQETIGSPVQSSLFDQSLTNRDINQGASQLRG